MSLWKTHKSSHATSLQDNCYYCNSALNEGNSSKRVLVAKGMSERKFRRLLLKKGIIKAMEMADKPVEIASVTSEEVSLNTVNSEMGEEK